MDGLQFTQAIPLSHKDPIQEVRRIEETYDRMNQLIATASMDSIWAIFCAHAWLNHMVESGLSNLRQRMKEWSFEENRTVVGTYNRWPNVFNIAGAGVQALSGGKALGAFWYLKAPGKKATDAEIRTYQTTVSKIQNMQQSWSSIGGFVQQFHGLLSTQNEGHRVEAQSHYGALTTQIQHMDQNRSQVKQTVTSSLEKAHEANKAKEQAFTSFNR